MSRERRVAVVTGAGKGIGKAIAVALARAGYDLGLQSRNEAELAQTARELQAEGARTVVVPGDVARSASASELIETAEAQLGPVAVAVGGAGQARSAPLLRTTAEDLQTLLEVNLISAFHLTQAAARSMITRKQGGRIVIVASTAGVRGARYTSAYCASKHGVLGLVRAAALELAAHRITVNALCPGWVDTAMFEATLANISAKTGRGIDEARMEIERRIPLGRVLEPEEVAAQLLYVVSDAASKLTGQALVLDGGELL